MLQQENYTVIAAFEDEVAENFGTQQVIKVPGEQFLQNKNFHKEVLGHFPSW